MPARFILVIADGFLWTRPLLHEPGGPIQANIDACKGLGVTVMTPATRGVRATVAVRRWLDEMGLGDATLHDDYRMPAYDELWASPECIGVPAPVPTSATCGTCGLFKAPNADCATCEERAAFKPPATLINDPPQTPEEAAVAAGTSKRRK